jgi:hypothetical protein
MTVWVEAWQQQCCGEPFGVGSTLPWTLVESDREYVDALFRPDHSVEVDRLEDRHGADPDAPDTVGTVMSIRSVHVRYAPTPDDRRVFYPVPESAELAEVDRSNGDELWSRDFAGYLVEIRTSDDDQPATR